MARALFIAPSPLEGYVFTSETDEKFVITNDGFYPTDMETADLEQINFDISIQATMDNCKGKLDMIGEEIQQAIENFE